MGTVSFKNSKWSVVLNDAQRTKTLTENKPVDLARSFSKESAQQLVMGGESRDGLLS